MKATTRVAVLLAIVAGTLVAVARPASADGGPVATNYKTSVLSVQPSAEGVSMRVIETGSRFEVTNSTRSDLVVLGYHGEPYLRIGPGGVFENRLSPAAYLGGARPEGAVPTTADPTAPPQWRKVAEGHTARWQDQRITWIANQDPPQVRRQPRQRHVVIPSWSVKMTLGGSPLAARGNVVWVPAPEPLPWALLAIAGFVAGMVPGLRRPWSARLGRGLGMLVVVDVFHALGIAWARAGGAGERLGSLAGSPLSFVVWAIAAVGIAMLARRSTDGLLAAALAGSFIALNGGLAHVSNLFRSQIPYAWGPDLARALVALSIGIGAGVTAGAVIALVRIPLPRGKVARPAGPINTA